MYILCTMIKELSTTHMSYCNNIMIEYRKSLPYNNNYTVKLVCIIIFVSILFRDFILPYIVYFLLYFFCMSTIYHYSYIVHSLFESIIFTQHQINDN